MSKTKTDKKLTADFTAPGCSLCSHLGSEIYRYCNNCQTVIDQRERITELESELAELKEWKFVEKDGCPDDARTVVGAWKWKDDPKLYSGHFAFDGTYWINGRGNRIEDYCNIVAWREFPPPPKMEIEK